MVGGECIPRRWWSKGTLVEEVDASDTTVVEICWNMLKIKEKYVKNKIWYTLKNSLLYVTIFN